MTCSSTLSATGACMGATTRCWPCPAVFTQPLAGQTWGCRPMLRSGQPARRHGLEQRQSPRRQPNHVPAAARRRLPRRQCPVPSRTVSPWDRTSTRTFSETCFQGNESVRRPPCLPAAACQNQPRRRRPVPSRWRPCLPQAWLPAACQLQRRRQHPVPSRPQAWLPAAQRRQHQLRLRRPAPSHGQVEQAALRQHPSRWRVCHVPSHPQAWLPAAQRRQRQLRLRHPAPSHWQVEQAAPQPSRPQPHRPASAQRSFLPRTVTPCLPQLH